MISQNDPDTVRRQAEGVGAEAYVAKSDLARDLRAAVDRAMADGKPVDATTAPEPGGKGKDWLFGGGTLGQLIREYDWSRTPLGPIEDWSSSLKISVNLMLNSQHPMWIGWGPEMIFLYNDA